MNEIKLIEKDTDIDSIEIKMLSWDIVVNDIPYSVAHFKGYNHSIGGKWGENDLWAWPRNEEPKYENLVEIGFDRVVNWGLEYKEKYYFKTKWDETELCCSSGTWIMRNNEQFYFVPGSMDYSLAKARSILTKVWEGGLDVNDIDFDKKLKGRVILFKGIPGVIERYINKQGCIIVNYTGPKKYKHLIPKIWRCEDVSDLSVKLDIIGYDHYDIDWYPEFRKEDGDMTQIEIFEKYFNLKENE